MITRIRRPDGTNEDIDHGPGPFGGTVKGVRGMPIAKAAALYALASSAPTRWRTEAASSGAPGATTSRPVATSSD